MTAPKWTPGPWVLGNENEYCADVSAGRVSFGLDRMDACGGQALVISRDEMLANAHLIAAAPELYAELERLVGLLAETSNYLGPFDHADRFALLRAGVLTGRRTLKGARGE